MRRPPLAGKIYYGWIIVAVTFLCLMISAGVRSAPGVLIHPLEQEFGWDRAAISMAVSIGLLLFGLSGPFAGQLIDRIGPRMLMIGGLILTSASSGLSVLMTDLWQLDLFWGVLSGVGTGALAGVIGVAVANRWFVAKRGVVVGITGAAVSAGQLVFVPGLMWLVLAVGWRGAVAALGLVVLAVLVPVFFLMKDDPADVGLPPYGGTTIGARSGGSASPLGAITGRAIRSKDFWLLAGQYFVCGATASGLVATHLIPHSIEQGISEVTAASALALMGAMNLVGSLASGWLTDRYDPRKLLACYYVLRGSALLMLPFVGDFSGLAIFATVYGLDIAATIAPTASLAADLFGHRNVGTVYGWVLLSHQIGASAVAYAAGWMRVSLGDYQLAFLFGGAMAILGALIALSITRVQRPAAVAAEPY